MISEAITPAVLPYPAIDPVLFEIGPFAVVEAGPISRPIAAKHGFQHLTTVWDYEWRG